MSELIERPDIAQRQGGFERDAGCGKRLVPAPLGAQQRREYGIDLATTLIDAPQGGQGALARLARGIAEGLGQLCISD